MAISNCLRNNSILTELDISSNRISPEGAAVIGKGLEMNETLRIFRVSISYSAHATLMKAYAENRRSVHQLTPLLHMLM